MYFSEFPTAAAIKGLEVLLIKGGFLMKASILIHKQKRGMSTT